MQSAILDGKLPFGISDLPLGGLRATYDVILGSLESS